MEESEHNRMNIAVIFAGGTGQRMNTRTVPKQFLELHGKPILIYTLDQFQQHDQIDGIILVSIKAWIGRCRELVERYHLTKVMAIVPGGANGQESIFNGLQKAHELCGDEALVLIHDGVRPLIDYDTISAAIDCTQRTGSAITVSPAIETITLTDDDGQILHILDRSLCHMAKAPQCFYLRDIYAAHLRAREENMQSFIDSASLMRYYGYSLHTVEGTPENIKITTPSDFYIFRAIVDARENSQIFS